VVVLVEGGICTIEKGELSGELSGEYFRGNISEGICSGVMYGCRKKYMFMRHSMSWIDRQADRLTD